MGLGLDYGDGQTLLSEEEKEGLLIPGILYRGELDEFEQLNIEKAIQWSLGRSIKSETLFTENFVLKIHEKMFGDVWAWAGEYRKSNKNIGVDRWQISVQLKYLLDDGRFWFQNIIYSPDELAIRFKHRLVSIHCFANGNGRHSRLVADMIIGNLYLSTVFSWGSGKNGSRSDYLKALKIADSGHYQPLIDFARS